MSSTTRRRLRLFTTAAAWILLLATLAAWAAGQLHIWHFAFGTTHTRGYVAFQTDYASFEFVHDPAGGARKHFGVDSSPRDELRYFHLAKTTSLLGIKLYHGVLHLPPGVYSPFKETHRFSIAALTLPNSHLLTLAALPAAIATWTFLRTRRPNRTHGFPLTPTATP